MTERLTLSLSCGSAGKESTCNAGDLASIPGLGRSQGEEIGYRYSGLESAMDYIVHGAARVGLSNFHSYEGSWGFPGGASSKEPTCPCERGKRHRFDPWLGKIPWRRKWQPNPVFLPGESHGRRSPEGYSPWGRKELDTTERLHFHFQGSSISSFLRNLHFSP